MELRQYVNVLLKWWWLIAAAVVVAGVSAFLGSLVTLKQYQSRTTLMVGQTMQNPNPSSSDLYTGQALAQSYGDLIKREPVMRATLTALGLDWDWATLQSMVQSRVVPNTTLIEITVLDLDPKRAQILTKEIANQLILSSPAGANVTDEAERQFAASQIEDIKANITHSQDEIRQLDDVISKATSARQIQDARQRQDSLRTQVTSWQQTYAQLQTILQQGTINFLSVVEPAQVLYTPVGVSTTSNMLLAAAIGLVLACGAAFVIEYLDDTVKTPDDVRQTTDLETLGSVVRIEGESYNTKLVAFREPRSRIAEAYRMLRTNLQFSMIDRPLQTLMITSANPEEGKSITAANVAVVMAQAGKRAVLVDADLRRPVQHQIFGLSNSMGLTSILLDSNIRLAETLQDTAVENLQIMTSGPLPPNPSELLGSKRMGNLIEALQKQADIIIFDTPPILPVADATILAARVDGTLLVVDSGHTRRALARRGKEALAGVGATVLGVVINRLPQPGKTSYNYYYAHDASPSAQGRSLPNFLVVVKSRMMEVIVKFQRVR